MKDVLQIIQEAEAEQAFVSSQSLQNLKRFAQKGNARLDIVQILSNNEEKIVSEAVAASISEASHLTALGKLHSEYQMSVCVRDCQIILRYITYAILAGDTSVLSQEFKAGLRETYITLGVSTVLVVRAVNFMEAAAIALVTNLIQRDEFLSEIVGYFTYVEDALKEEPQALEEEPKPLWMRLVSIGAQIPKHEWAELPTDLSRNFEHHMYGASKEE